MARTLNVRNLLPVAVVAAILALSALVPAGGIGSLLSGYGYGSFGYNFSGGGIVVGGPDATGQTSTNVDVFVRGTDNALWSNSFTGSGFAGWLTHGGILTSDPGALSNPNTSSGDEVFVRGTDNAIWTQRFASGAGQGWVTLGGIGASGPDGDAYPGGTHRDVFVQGTDGQLWQKSSSDGGVTWGAWQGLGGILTADPGAVSSQSGHIDVFVRGTDRQMWWKSWNGTTWSAWVPLGGILVGGPDAASCTAGHLDVFVLGTDGQYWRKGYNGSSWTPWIAMGIQSGSDPGAACRPGTGAVDVFYRGANNAIAVLEVAAT